jgi:hypothetical protein
LRAPTYRLLATRFARTYGVIAGGVVPMFSYGLWLSRDVMTMSAAFTLPPIVGSMVESTGLLSTSTSKVRFYYDAILFPTNLL